MRINPTTFTLGLISTITGILLRGPRRRKLTLQQLAERPQPSTADLREKIKTYGLSSNSFLTLYPGFTYFNSKDPAVAGTVAFVDTDYAWVAATEPLADEKNKLILMQEFSTAARAAGKSAIFIPVGADTAQKAKTIGYDSLMIGSEPVFELKTFDCGLDNIFLAKQMKSRGAQVQAFEAKTITVEKKREFDEIILEWLETRRMTPLSFLNKVAPWEHSADKRYFSVEQNGRTLAFVAAIPIWPRNGWYLIDLLRRSDAPIGATEFLVLEALRLLKDQGAKEVTLGVSPLSQLEKAPRHEHPFIYAFFKLLYRHAGGLYRFQPLYQFKLKFRPSRWDPAYLSISPPRLGVYSTLGLLEAFMPGGITKASASGARRFFSRFDVEKHIKNIFSSSIIIRTLPSDFIELLKFCPLTIALVLTSTLAAFYGSSLPEAARGFSWSAFSHGHIESLLLSPLLHLNPIHANLELLALALFSGTLECLGGTALLALCFFVPLLFSNPLTGGIFIFPFQLFHHDLWEKMALSVHVGAATGILGSVAGLSYFLKNGRLITVGLALIFVVYAVATTSPISATHLTGLGLGLLMGRLYLGGNTR